MPVSITKNGSKVVVLNNLTDAGDYLIDENLPRGLFIKREPHTGYSCETLPWRFGWDGNFYIVENAPIEEYYD